MISAREIFRLPEESIAKTPTGFVAEWQVPATLPYFEGHFDGMPVVPAAVVVEASREFLSQGMSRPLSIAGITSAKFMSVLGAGMEMRVTFDRESATQWLVEWREKNAEARLIARISLRLG